MDKGHTIPILGGGYVRYVDHLGSDQRITETARISYLSPSKGELQDKELLFYLFKKRHTSPFESSNITFNIRMPIFCMRQFVRHRTFRLNEQSGRYSELPSDFYVPDVWRGPDDINRQSSVPVRRDLPGHEEWHEENDRLARGLFAEAYAVYQEFLNRGVAKELARIVLPVGIFTEIYVSCDVHNLIHFLNLRQDSHAQWEMREIANAMSEAFQKFFPWCAEARSKYKWRLVE
jgi:thymidylate synthase (FAD)